MCELHCSQLKTGQYLRVYDPPSEAEEKSWMATHLPCTDLLVRRILSELECTPYHGTCDTKTGAFCCSLFSISLGCVHFVTLPGLFFAYFFLALIVKVQPPLVIMMSGHCSRSLKLGINMLQPLLLGTCVLNSYKFC